MALKNSTMEGFMRLHIELDRQALQRLIEVAVAERRPITWQAEVLIRRALGLPETSSCGASPDAGEEVNHDRPGAGGG